MVDRSFQFPYQGHAVYSTLREQLRGIAASDSVYVPVPAGPISSQGSSPKLPNLEAPLQREAKIGR